MLVIKNLSSQVGRHYFGKLNGVPYDWSVSRCDPKVDLYEIAFYNYDSEDTEIAALNIYRKPEACGGYRCQLYYHDYKTLIWSDILPLRHIASPNTLFTGVVNWIVSESIRRKGSV